MFAESSAKKVCKQLTWNNHITSFCGPIINWCGIRFGVTLEKDVLTNVRCLQLVWYWQHWRNWNQSRLLKDERTQGNSKESLHCTFNCTRLLIEGGTPFEATHKYAAICNRLIFVIDRISPSTTLTWIKKEESGRRNKLMRKLKSHFSLCSICIK